jgi:hypothetical protein
MIASWKDFFIAVERMRRRQKVYFLCKSPSNLNKAKECEAEVDACIEKKRAEWDRREREKQPELMEVTHE